jgi:hypothetical protein
MLCSCWAVSTTSARTTTALPSSSTSPMPLIAGYAEPLPWPLG